MTDAEYFKLLSTKELAYELGRSRTYVTAMKRLGFPMPGSRATLTDAINWLKNIGTRAITNVYKKSAQIVKNSSST